MDWPGSVIDLLSECWTLPESNKNNDLNNIDEDAKNTNDENTSKLVASMPGNEHADNDFKVDQGNCLELTPINSEQNETEETFFNNQTAIKNPLLDPYLDKSRKKSKNNSVSSHNYSLRSNNFEYLHYLSPSSDHVSDPDWKATSQKPTAKKTQRKRKSYNFKRNCSSEPSIIPYSLRSRNSTFSNSLHPQEKHNVQQYSELIYNEEQLGTREGRILSEREITSQANNYKDKPMRPKKGEKRKGNIIKAPTKKPCWNIKKAINPQNITISVKNSRSQKEVKRSSRSTLKVKKMLLEIESALNQVEATLTDWNYGSRIPTTAEASNLLYKLQEINTSLKDEFDIIRENSNQMDIMESFLDFMRKTENLTFAIQRRIKKLNKKNAANMIDVDSFIPLLENFKIQDDANDNRNIRSKSIIKKPHLLINRLNENSNESTFSEEIMQNEVLNTVGDFHPINKSFLNDFKRMEEYKSEVNSRSPIFKTRTEFPKPNFDTDLTEPQQLIKLTNKAFSNSEYGNIPNMFGERIGLPNLKHKDTNSITEKMSIADQKVTENTTKKQHVKSPVYLKRFPVSNCEELSKSALKEKSLKNMKKYCKSTIQMSVKNPTFPQVSTRSSNHFETKEESMEINKSTEENIFIKAVQNCEDKMRNIGTTVGLSEKKSFFLMKETNGLLSHDKKIVKPLKIFLDKNKKSTSVTMKKDNLENLPKEKHVFGKIGAFQHLSFSKLIDSTTSAIVQHPDSYIMHKSLPSFNSEEALNPSPLLITETSSNKSLINKANLLNSTFTNISRQNHITGFVIADENVSLKLITKEYNDRENTGVCQILLFTNKDEGIKGGVNQSYSKHDKIVNSAIVKSNKVSCFSKNKEEHGTGNSLAPISGELDLVMSKFSINSNEHIGYKMSSTEHIVKPSKITHSTKKLKTDEKVRLISSTNERKSDYASTVMQSNNKNKNATQGIKLDMETYIKTKKHNNNSLTDALIKTKFEDKNFKNEVRHGSELDGQIHSSYNNLNQNENVISCNKRNNKNVSRNSEIKYSNSNDLKYRQISSIKSNNGTVSQGNVPPSNDINRPCIDIDNRNGCKHDINRSGENETLSNELSILEDVAQLCTTEEFLQNSLDVDFIDEIINEFDKKQICDNNGKNLAESQEKLLQDNYSLDNNLNANENAHSVSNKTTSEEIINVDFMNFDNHQGPDFFQCRKEVKFPENTATNVTDIFKVPLNPVFKSDSTSNFVTKEASRHHDLNSPTAKKRLETKTKSVPKNDLNECNQNLTHEKGNNLKASLQKKAFSIENIKYIRQKSEGEFLQIDDFSDLFSSNIFTW